MDVMDDRSSTVIVRRIALGALFAILVALTVYYIGARSSEDGTRRDDSPAAELGVGASAGDPKTNAHEPSNR